MHIHNNFFDIKTEELLNLNIDILKTQQYINAI